MTSKTPARKQPQAKRVPSAVRVLDVDLARAAPWTEALRPVAKAGRTLVTAFNEQGQSAVGAFGWAVLGRVAGALHTVLGSHYGGETDDIAAALGVPAREVVLANAAYDLSNSVGCSTLVAQTPTGPLHARNLDWSFPRGLLRKHLVVAEVRGGARGGYALVTWPGMFGALTGIAPGRFSVTVNFVTHDEQSAPAALLARAVKGYWPVAWAVRRAFDEAKDVQAAVRLLRDVPLLSPALLTVAGVGNGERVCLERGADEAASRAADGERSLVVTNHYQSRQLAGHNDGLEEMDTCERAEALEQLLGREKRGLSREAALKALSAGEIFNQQCTQHQVVMQPSTGLLVVRVPGGGELSMQVSS